MIFTTTDKTIKTIRQSDPDFMLNNGIQIVPRSAIEFSELCPTSLILQVQNAIGKGWIKPLAYIKESEYTWEKLGE